MMFSQDNDDGMIDVATPASK
jgi:hypothetical protein